MSNAYPLVQLCEVIRHRKEFFQINDLEQYKRCRVQLHAQGVVLRDTVAGAEIKTKTQQVCKAGEFLVAEIDAKVGGFGIVPPPLEGAIVSSHYFLFGVNEDILDRRFLDYFVRTPGFQEQVAAQGTTNYAAIRPAHVLAYQIPLPPLAEQRRIVARIEAIVTKITEVRTLRTELQRDARRMLLALYSRIVQDAPHLPMKDVAPLERRPVKISIDGQYQELGVRSFGKGTFHKPAIEGSALGTKKIFHIQPSDLLFNIVFAWEGAIAVAQPEDEGRVGSHRFLTCVPEEGVATSDFLCFHFLTEHGLYALDEASPGGAGRNRTLGLHALERICVPVPPIEKQRWFDGIQAQVTAVRRLQTETAAELDALLPAILHRAFRGEL